MGIGKTREEGMAGVALDIDGVLRQDSTLLPGARDAVCWLAESGLPFVLVSNITSCDRASLARSLLDSGLPVAAADVVTPSKVAADYIRASGPDARCYVVAEGQPFTESDGLTLVDEDVTHVVFGGAGPSIGYEQLNAAFGHLTAGAELVALHRNLSWRTSAGLALDSGAFVLGLEAAAGVTAKVLGKPEAEFFRLALATKGIDPCKALMVGDDVVTDVLAAQAIGMTGVLVRTGKFSEAALVRAGGKADYVIDSIADLGALIARLDIPTCLSGSRSMCNVPC
jgi:HAD superfamily hydrolase (TIGR01458 family)